MTVKIERKWGFGMAPIKREVQDKREKSVAILLSAIKEEIVSEDAVESLSSVKGLFNRIHRQDQWDWFTIFEQFGCPGRVKCRKIARNISELRKVVLKKSDREVSEVFSDFKDLDLARYLERFLDQSIPQKEPEKIYILSTREQKSFLKIGYTTRKVVERVNEINSATGVVIPFGVRAVWCVKDARRLEKKIHEVLSDYRVRSDREFFAMDYFDAFKTINQVIRDERVEEL